MNRFDKRVAVITGGASGIGLAIVRRLVKEGGHAVIGDVNSASLKAAKTELGDAVSTAVVDVRQEAQVAAMTTQALENFGRLDLGFNCAGLGVGGELIDLSEEDWDTTVDTCLKGMFFSVKHEARAMRDGGGAIVNVASINCHVPLIGGTAYACAKAGVEMLSRNAALELAERKIRVNTVSPGLTDTPLTAGLKTVPGLESAYLERIPMNRWGTAEDIGAADLFLASDDAAYISGSNLIVDGAWETAGYPDMRRYLQAQT